MRVVAGTAGGRRLAGPPGRSTRPTSDRVREATFNALASLGVLPGATVLDLFAGSGALGIEALSRGAARVTFVDADPRALTVVRANLAATGLAAEADVVRSDAARFLAGAPGRFDLALLDPPYRFDDRAWASVLARLEAELAVLESDREIDPGEGWELLRCRSYGATVVALVRVR
ncbi:MAG: 16S rRNA (guanine(966)-N(2))-methyltransferase RsmD [Acidimicrobiales bacterium]